MAATESGIPLLCLSDLAEHSRQPRRRRPAGVAAGRRGRRPGHGPALAGARATLLGELSRGVAGSERADVDIARYRAAHPERVAAP